MPRRKQSSGAHGSKTTFVRGLPASMPAKEVVAKAKEAGITLSESYVYGIRSSKTGARGPRKGRAPRATITTPRANKVEDVLHAVAAEIGLSRAITLLQERQRMVRAVLGG